VKYKYNPKKFFTVPYPSFQMSEKIGDELVEKISRSITMHFRSLEQRIDGLEKRHVLHAAQQIPY